MQVNPVVINAGILWPVSLWSPEPSGIKSYQFGTAGGPPGGGGGGSGPDGDGGTESIPQPAAEIEPVEFNDSDEPSES